MLLLNTVFIFSSLRPVLKYTYLTCVSLGVLLHYSTLAALLWMGVEAANMYQMLVQVFTSSERCFLLKRCLIGWGNCFQQLIWCQILYNLFCAGLPIIVVGITIGVDTNYYYDPDDRL